MAPSTFTASYQVGTDASLQLSGDVPGAGGVEATRFFARGLRPTTVGSRSVLEGVLPATNTVDGTTVHVVVWSDGDVRLMLKLISEPGRASTAADLDAFVRATHRLDRSQWEQLLDDGTACLLNGRGESSSASGSGSSTGSTTTSLGSRASTGSSSTSATTVTTLGR